MSRPIAQSSCRTSFVPFLSSCLALLLSMTMFGCSSSKDNAQIHTDKSIQFKRHLVTTPQQSPPKTESPDKLTLASVQSRFAQLIAARSKISEARQYGLKDEIRRAGGLRPFLERQKQALESKLGDLEHDNPSSSEIPGLVHSECRCLTGLIASLAPWDRA